MQDPAGFRQILCSSAMHMSRLRGEAESTEAIDFSTHAIQSVNRRLMDPVIGISDGIIATVLAFACHAVSKTIKGYLQEFSLKTSNRLCSTTYLVQ
jgi:hypothetical protein